MKIPLGGKKKAVLVHIFGEKEDDSSGANTATATLVLEEGKTTL